MAAGALREVLAGDGEGSLRLTAVQLIADLVRRKNCMCPAHVRPLPCITDLHLRLHPPERCDPDVQRKGRSLML